VLKRLLRALAAIAAISCSDFGYRAAPVKQPDAAAQADDGGGSDDGCLEGPTAPRDDGPQLHFYALDVDLHVLNVRPGETVTWNNGSPMAHAVTAGTPASPIPVAQGGFDSGNLASGGGRFAWRFCKKRTITWFCRTHPAQMFGYQIVVGP
jgi:hypothetical protein